MKNVFLLLKANRAIRKDILGKRIIIFLFGISCMLAGAGIILFAAVFKKMSGDEMGTSAIFLIQLQLSSMLIFMLDGFLVLRNFGSQEKGKTEDLRDYLFHLPFCFSDFIIAGLFILWCSFLFSGTISIVYSLAAYFLNATAHSKGLIGFAMLLNCVEFFLLFSSFLAGAFGKRKGYASSVLYFLNFIVFMGGTFVVSFFDETNFCDFLSPLCSPFGALLLLLPIPVSGLLTWIFLKLFKKRTWYNA